MASPPSTLVDSLYRQHHGWLQGWLNHRLGSTPDAADLAQDTFMRVLLRPRGFDSSEGARAYLRVIAKGLCIDLWRRRDVERAWREAVAAQPQAVVPSPEHQAIVIETLLEVAALLRGLPVKAAQAFILVQVEGLKYQEIAQLLGVSERMVKKYMAQALLHCALAAARFAEASAPQIVGVHTRAATPQED